MKRCILVSLLSLAFALLLPPALLRLLPARSAAPAAETLAPAESGDDLVRPGADESVTVSFLYDGKVRRLTLAEYLPGVLAGEMPAGFEPEALRAQATAARTFALFRERRGSPAHPGAAVCGDPACCQVWVDEETLRERWGEDYELCHARILAAVADTDGAYLTYEGEPILACFHSSSAGQTENSAAVWGAALPYLVSVASPETAGDVPDFVSTAEISPEDFRETILAEYPGCSIRESLPPDWLGARTLDTGGRVASVRVGDVSVSGTKMRSLFGLRSACFTLEWTGHSFLFTVAGSGHGAGMSQYGANVMAREGKTWREILAHYYPGTVLSSLTA